MLCHSLLSTSLPPILTDCDRNEILRHTGYCTANTDQHIFKTSFGPGIHVDVTLTSTAYLKTIAHHLHPFMAMVYPDDSGLFQQANAPCHTAKTVAEWFKERDKRGSRFAVVSKIPQITN